MTGRRRRFSFTFVVHFSPELCCEYEQLDNCIYLLFNYHINSLIVKIAEVKVSEFFLFKEAQCGFAFYI